MYGQTPWKQFRVWKEADSTGSSAQGGHQERYRWHLQASMLVAGHQLHALHGFMDSRTPHPLIAQESRGHIGFPCQRRRSLESLNCFKALISRALFLCSLRLLILCHCCDGESIPELEVVLVLWLSQEEKKGKQTNETKYNILI